jgi:hypothetical protein
MGGLAHAVPPTVLIDLGLKAIWHPSDCVQDRGEALWLSRFTL